jgi:hypothetical protein
MILLGLLLGLMTGLAAVPAQAGPPGGQIAPVTAIWGCDAPAGRTCYFSIQFAGGGVRNFSLPAGARTAEGGVTPGLDHYLVSMEVANLGDVMRCRELSLMGRACRKKTVDAGYND